MFFGRARAKQAAMERYAMKRMRRRFKSQSPLIAAVMGNSIDDLVQTLGSADNAAINHQDEVSGDTILHVALDEEEEKFEFVRVIVEDSRFVKVHQKNKKGVTPLYRASQKQFRNSVALLLTTLTKDSQLVVSLTHACLKFVNEFNNGHTFVEWLKSAVKFGCELCSGISSWSSAIESLKTHPFIATVEFPCPIKELELALKVLRTSFNDSKHVQILHVHLVGDGKAGKSVAAKWFIELFHQSKHYLKKNNNATDKLFSINEKQKAYHHENVATGRTRGVKTTTLRFQDETNLTKNKQIKEYIIMIHDYGGQEEFLSNHSTFLSTNNSIYIIVVPLIEIGDTIEQRRVRTITEMLERYLFWCRFIFSVVKRDQAFPIIENDDMLLQQHDTTSEYITSSNRGIPMITLINNFNQYCNNEQYKWHIDNTIPVLQKQLKNEFSLSNNIEDSNCDFVVTNDIFYVTDNSCNKDILDIIRVIEGFVDNTIVNGGQYEAGVLDHVTNAFDIAHLPDFMTEKEWKQWIHLQISNYLSKHSSTNHDMNLLDNNQRIDILDILSYYCEECLITSNTILQLHQPVNEYKYITKPSLLSSEIVGDLMWWFHRHHINKSDIHALRLSQASIIEKLMVVEQERQLTAHTEPTTSFHPFQTMKTFISSLLPHNAKVHLQYQQPSSSTSALDALSKIGYDTIPLVELLNKIGIGLEIYDNKTKEKQSWLLGLASDFPKGKKELRYDWWPDYEIRRYYRLPDTRACFVPGYFLSLFVKLVNTNGYELYEGYGNAAKLGRKMEDGCSIQIILCQLSDKDQDALIVSVAGIGPNANTNASKELHMLRTCIYADNWGLNFQEFCLINWHIPNQMILSRVREDLLEGKLPIDEIIPMVLGIPRYIEHDCEEADIDSDTRLSLYARIELIHQYFGCAPRSPVSSNDSNHDGLHALRQLLTYTPSMRDLKEHRYLNHKTISRDAFNDVDDRWIDLSLSDIFQQYSQSCYDNQLWNISNTIESLLNMHELCIQLDITREQIPEIVYRIIKLRSNLEQQELLTVRQFDTMVHDVMVKWDSKHQGILSSSDRLNRHEKLSNSGKYEFLRHSREMLIKHKDLSDLPPLQVVINQNKVDEDL